MQQLDPALVDAVLGMRQLDPQAQQMQRQQQIAQALRAGALQGMQQPAQMMGRVVVPQTALNALGNVMQMRHAQRMGDEADVGLRNIGVQRGDAIRRYFEKRPGAATQKMQLPHMGDEGE